MAGEASEATASDIERGILTSATVIPGPMFFLIVVQSDSPLNSNIAIDIPKIPVHETKKGVCYRVAHVSVSRIITPHTLKMTEPTKYKSRKRSRTSEKAQPIVPSNQNENMRGRDPLPSRQNGVTNRQFPRA